jgi:hypothetical protein
MREVERTLADIVSLICGLRKVSDALYTHQYEESVKLSSINAEVLEAIRSLRDSADGLDAFALRNLVEFVESKGNILEYVESKEGEIARTKATARGKAQAIKDFHTRLRDAMGSETQFQK